MSFKTFFSKQAGHPSGLFGRLVMSRIFDLGNTRLNNFMQEQLKIEENDHVLEIGYGTGKLINELSKSIKTGLIEGVDISSTMTRIAEKRNRKAIMQDRVIVRQGDFDAIKYKESSFDKVYSANTIYFWPKPEKTIENIFKILKPGGKLILAFEDKKQLKNRPLDSDVFRIYDENDVKDLLRSNGFSENIEVKSRKINSDIYHCCIARKRVRSTFDLFSPKNT